MSHEMWVSINESRMEEMMVINENKRNEK